MAVSESGFRVGDILIGNDKNKYHYTNKNRVVRVISVDTSDPVWADFITDKLDSDIAVIVLGDELEDADDRPFRVNSEYFDLYNRMQYNEDISDFIEDF